MLTNILHHDKIQNVDKTSTQHLDKKGGEMMVNTQLLDDAIKISGKSKSHLASKCNMSVQTFRLKRLNVSPFSTDDVNTLCDELDIKTLTRKEQIFFAKNVEKTST